VTDNPGSDIGPSPAPDLPSHRLRQLKQCAQDLGLPTSPGFSWVRLDQALTHKSVDATYNYEQLELLGDAVLRLVATEFLQQTFPAASVGEISAVRSPLISDRTLGQLAQTLGLAPYLAVADGMGVGPTHLADALEAVVAALYLETHSLEAIHSWLDAPLQQLTATIGQDHHRQNPKLALQELTQAHRKVVPQYRTVEQNPVDGDPHRFKSAVWFQSVCWGIGHGPTKKQAEQAAAAAAYDRLAHELGSTPLG
jgi:ribonuclease III